MKSEEKIRKDIELARIRMKDKTRPTRLKEFDVLEISILERVLHGENNEN